MARPRMQGTLTVRFPSAALQRIRRRARELGATPSDLVRSLVEKHLPDEEIGSGPTLYELSRKWIRKTGSRRVSRGRDARRALDKWAPDRRG